MVKDSGKQFHKAADDAGGKQGNKMLPVRLGIVQETINGIFREVFFIGARFQLYRDAPFRKHHVEEVPEDVHDRNTFLFSSITFEKQLAEVESIHKFCSKI